MVVQRSTCGCSCGRSVSALFRICACRGRGVSALPCPGGSPGAKAARCAARGLRRAACGARPVRPAHGSDGGPARPAPGGSLGPEAALLALCGAAVSGVASGVFGFRGKRLRDCALMGMTAGLAAFFGVALGGSLFALEARATAGAGPHHSVAVSYARRSAGRLLV